jgi:hypothetical protein
VPEDCFGDTACIEHKCRKLLRGEPCDDVYAVGGTCEAPYGCVAPVAVRNRCWQMDQNEAGCLGLVDCWGEPECAFSVETGYCDPRAGTCQPLPTSGACAGGFCAPGHYCDLTGYPPLGQCFALPTDGPCGRGSVCAYGYYCHQGDCDPQAEKGQSCTGELDSCAVGHACQTGTCVVKCEIDADCGAGFYCNTVTARCVAKAEVCQADRDCEAGQYCQTSTYVCDRLRADRAACDAEPRCAYSVDGCAISCSLFDNNPTGCAGTGGCTYDATNGWCNPNPGLDCAPYANDPAACDAAPGCITIGRCLVEPWACTPLAEGDCRLHPGCQWNPTGGTGSGACVKVSAECVDRYPSGALCTPALQGVDCASGKCAADVNGTARCTVVVRRGCLYGSDVLRAVFIFGLVWTVGARRLRRKTKA